MFPYCFITIVALPEISFDGNADKSRRKAPTAEEFKRNSTVPCSSFVDILTVLTPDARKLYVLRKSGFYPFSYRFISFTNVLPSENTEFIVIVIPLKSSVYKVPDTVLYAY